STSARTAGDLSGAAARERNAWPITLLHVLARPGTARNYPGLTMAFVLKTMFLDAGGVLVFPNWARISSTLRRFGVTVDARELERAEPLAKRQLDDSQTVH